VTGVGKSATIGRKIVATFNSINIPASFLHAADALHGDLGSLQSEDVVICLSKSGNTTEIRALVPLIKAKAKVLIAVVSLHDSCLAQEADICLFTPFGKEADPHDLAPTTSTIAQLAMGDALAVCLIHLRNFKPDEFAQLHPGGMLGKQLNLLVRDLILLHEIPQVHRSASIEDVIVEISSKRLGATAVLDDQSNICGIITDGDLRRMLEHPGDYRGNRAEDVMSRSPKSIASEAKAIDALKMMRAYNITQLLAIDRGQYVGVIHIHDLLREGF
jgi:arabinose-5-phosphate isomerase